MSNVTYIRSVLKQIEWLGAALADLRLWPKPIMRQAGFELEKVQRGEKPENWKPMPTVGAGVEEIRVMDAEGQYRILYVAKFTEAIYVLHVITKKRTNKTALRDINLAKKNYKEVLAVRRKLGQ